MTSPTAHSKSNETHSTVEEVIVVEFAEVPFLYKDTVGDPLEKLLFATAGILNLYVPAFLIVIEILVSVIVVDVIFIPVQLAITGVSPAIIVFGNPLPELDPLLEPVYVPVTPKIDMPDLMLLATNLESPLIV